MRLLVVLVIVFIVAWIELAKGQAVAQQVIFPPPQFDNATQWGIGVGATPSHDACLIVGYNYTDGRAFAQYYDEDPISQNMTSFGTVMYGAIMTGFDTTEMNPAGALLTTDKLSAFWSISTVNDSNIAYGYAYYFSRPDNQSSFALTQTFTDPIPGASRLYGGAFAGTSDGSLIAIGAAVYPVSGPSNTIPSTVEIWAKQANGSYILEYTISNIETRTGLWGYSLALAENKRWVAVGAWAYHPRSIFLYERINSTSYNLTATLAPFGNVTRFSYSISFSPDSQWLIVGVFQYPSPGFTGAVLAYQFDETLDTWDTSTYYFLSTGFDYGDSAPGQGASVSISNAYQLQDGSTAWSLVYGMPYLAINSSEPAFGGVSVWTFDSTLANWTELLPPLEGFGNLTGSFLFGPGNFSEPPVQNSTMWQFSSFGDTVTERLPNAADGPYLDLGWPATPNRMISYDGCSVLVPGISNVGISTGFVFRWLNVTVGCPRLPSPTPNSPISPPTSQNISITPGIIAVIVVVIPVAIIYLGAIVCASRTIGNS